ncbi:uncharacterized protein N7484_000458 [Penicillium longicatenatum]|uniref:uncharacterized protein n=1 Tax=Penicillium longicatenatum TaxID=1561947 RepID=UPI0025479BEF|nr:uncharacterized protein N7484_000458 [Penicillium longicatenatum]KAJ5661086.1 hypothetical protein N7484_000458 [Penicillium longicatenatum]
MMQLKTSIQQDGTLETLPVEVFGQGEVILRIGNGGAGGIGLIEALANDYLSLRHAPGSIAWVCNHSRNTQLALFNGHIDLALTYEREQEEISVLEGWAQNAGCIFHDHFCLIGPEHDPANIREARSIEDAFERIFLAEFLFHSRSDGSATMCKEREIWRRCHRSPWNAKSTWYIQTKQSEWRLYRVLTFSLTGPHFSTRLIRARLET